MSDQGNGIRFRLRSGRTLGYAEHGAPDGAPIFCFHGVAGSRLGWRLFEGPDLPASVSVGRFVAESLPECEAVYFEDEGHMTLPRNHINGILTSLVSRPGE